MTPDNEVIMLALAGGFVFGVAAAGAIFSCTRWVRAKWSHRNEVTVVYSNWRLPGRASFERAVQERDAYRDEVALMAREDAHWMARSLAAKVTARVQLRMAEGDHHG